MGRDGLLDLHSHLLPGIDDGCRSLEDSLACARELLKHGFAGTVCTPHMAVRDFPGNTPRNVARRVQALQEQFDAAGLEYRLWAGGEVRIADGTVGWFQEHGVPTLGDGRCVLIDYWGDCWPDCGDPVIEYLFENGYQPILAHPERMNFADEEWSAVLQRLESSGVWLQGNLKCIAGREGTRIQERSHRLLESNRYRLLATDMHGPADLHDRLAGLEAVERRAGDAVLARMLGKSPQEILATE